MVYSIDIQEAAMRTKIAAWGNSLGLRIPKPFARELGLGPGDAVELSLADGRLVVRPATTLSLGELLADVTDANRHGEIDAGGPRGNEAW